MSEIKRGQYRHYKGAVYKVLNTALNSENKERLVIYQDEEDASKIWARPEKIFLEKVLTEEGEKNRFEFLGDENGESSQESKDSDELNDSDESNDSDEQKYLRALADYQNLLKQTARDKQEFVKYAVGDFLLELLPIYDHLKLSLSGLGEEESRNPWAVGVSHVIKQFKEVLTARGVEEIKTIGEKFNHDTMEAVSGEGEMISQEISPGYKLNGRVIRPAKVIVGSETK